MSEVQTVELDVDTEHGYVGGEETVAVTESGTEWVREPQRESWRP